MKTYGADRQPEFTQIDVETSFLTAPEVREIMERMVHGLWQNIIGVDLGKIPTNDLARSDDAFWFR